MFTIASSPLDHQSFNRVVQHLASILQAGDTLFLQGGLGAGKTTFVQQAAIALGIGEDQYVSSPSYGLLHEYQGKLTVYHMDLYRLADEDDVEAAGLLDYFSHSGVSFIEWPERLGTALPAEYLWVRIDTPDTDVRKLRLDLHGTSWKERAAQLSSIFLPTN